MRFFFNEIQNLVFIIWNDRYAKSLPYKNGVETAQQNYRTPFLYDKRW